ncbi:unnamed protein product, partial [marine sediment metagenome]
MDGLAEKEQDAPEIDGMESNIQDSFDVDLLGDTFNNEQNLFIEEEKPVVQELEKKVDPEIVIETKEEVKPATVEELMSKITGLNETLAEERGRKHEAQQQVINLTNGQQPKKEEPKAEEFDWQKPEKTIEKIKNDLRQENQLNFLNMSQAQ